MDLYKCLGKLTPLRQKQLRHALFVNHIASFEELTTFSKYERETLLQELPILPFTVKSEQFSKDGTAKWAFTLSDGNIIETVLMQFRDGRNTVCVSSQSGCPSGCLFCATGQNGFKRNLTAWEIVSQVLHAVRYLKRKGLDSGSQATGRNDKEGRDKTLTNVVFMGMGEPLLNLENVLKSIAELNNPDYFNLGRRHIAVSTCGVIPQLEKFIEADTGTVLAISLHAPNQVLREKLMPIAKSNPLPKLMQTLDGFVMKTNKKITYEYLMLDGVNDSPEMARELSALLRNRLALVNLIAYNSVPGLNFRPSTRDKIDRFRSEIERAGIPVTVRVSLGDEIDAACGQLAGKE
jgi:23S rRNA (adenine2503-C2)-methyltransferase